VTRGMADNSGLVRLGVRRWVTRGLAYYSGLGGFGPLICRRTFMGLGSPR